jgi:uracil-DNA glycosylase
METAPAPNINPVIEESWKSALTPVFQQPFFMDVRTFLLHEKNAGKKIYPPGNLIFNAFNLTPVDKVKVVLLGQDPYHGHGQAHGLCFSVPDGMPLPPSLKNIFKELQSDLAIPVPTTGNLENWAKQGVLMLNATLTVRASEAGSHQNQGWEQFTDAVIQYLSSEKSGLVFILWGKYAQAKAVLIDDKKHFILKAAHPSPFSAYNGFFGCGHFSKTNEILIQSGKTPINWNPALK